MFNLSPKILVFYSFNNSSVGQMVNGYMDVSALVGDSGRLFNYVAQSQNNSYIKLIADELGLNSKELFFIHKSHYWMHPKLVPHFAAWLGDEYLSFVLDALKYWAQATVDPMQFSLTPEPTLAEKSGQICNYLRRCYRLDCESVYN